MSGFRIATVILLFAVGACSSPRDQQVSIAPVRAAAPPAGYTLISSSDTSTEKNIQIGVNTDLLGGDDGRLAFHFGFHFPGAVREAQAADLATNGDGLSVNSPIVFSPPATAVDEVQGAVNLVARRAPDRENLVGTLLRSPDHRYLLLIEFENKAGKNALYFDVTNWAKATLES